MIDPISVAIGALLAPIVGFFVWRNNRAKFEKLALEALVLVNQYDTVEEAKAKLQELLAVFLGREVE
jgi:hypothetical protein